MFYQMDYTNYWNIGFILFILLLIYLVYDYSGCSKKSKFIKEEKGDLLKYEDQVGGADCYVIYTFNDNNKLISGNYVFTKQYSNSQLYLHDYTKFEKLLTEKICRS